MPTPDMALFGPPARRVVNDVPSTDVNLLRAMNENGGEMFSSGSRGDAGRARQLRRLAADGLVTFLDGPAVGWDKGMWGAYLTCLGINVVYRSEHDTHPHPGTKDGQWLPNGTCTGCSKLRRLDWAAYQAYLDTLEPAARENQLAGPQLYCREHGWMRTRNITTKKVCILRGSPLHDGGLDRS